jgi:hypothetical protein
MTFSAAMSGPVHAGLGGHLLRVDGQEDVCLAVYSPSTGTTRSTAVIADYLLPLPGERAVHGNASFTGDYLVRAAVHAASLGRGVVAAHSHPGGIGWQSMSSPDYDTERSYAHLVYEITGLPLVGMTLAGDGSWSCRQWDPSGTPAHGESVRVVDDRFRVTWNNALRPIPTIGDSQVRTVSAWGEAMQASLARTRVLVVGVSSVGLDVALRLAATGIVHVGVMDFDDPEYIRGASTDMRPKRQNVAALAASVSASILAQFVSLTVAPGGIGAPGPLRYALSTHTLEHLRFPVKPQCAFESATATGDRRIPLTGPHTTAQQVQRDRRNRQAQPATRVRRWLSARASQLVDG